MGLHGINSDSFKQNTINAKPINHPLNTTKQEFLTIAQQRAMLKIFSC